MSGDPCGGTNPVCSQPPPPGAGVGSWSCPHCGHAAGCHTPVATISPAGLAAAVHRMDAIFDAMIVRDYAIIEARHQFGDAKTASLGGYVAGTERAREVIREALGLPVYDADGVLTPLPMLDPTTH